MIRQHITHNMKKESKRKAIKTAMKIKSKGVFNGTAYWEFKKSIDKPKKIKGTSINDKNGKRIDDPVKVKERYQEFYKELLTTRKPDNEEEEKLEKIVNKCIETMEKRSEDIEIEPMTDEEYDDMKNSLNKKKNKAADMQGWCYEMVIHAGKDLEESIKMMIRQMMKTKTVAEEWNKMCIQPKDKKSGWLEMTEKRGLFLTNILSKCVEKIMFKRREDTLIDELSPYQNGGVTERGIQDNLFIVNYVVNKYSKENKNLYLLFSDIEKCFDNLWLRDCILELIRCGTPIEEAMYILQMNKHVLATVRTPVGDTEEVELEEIVRQGTVGGNKLCIVSTDRINKMGLYYEKDGIRFPIFVDDKIGMGDIETLEEMEWRMGVLETSKKYKYNNKKGKTEWMVIRNDRKKTKIEEPKLKVSSGPIGRTKEYKYHGDMYDEKGTNESKIRHKESKVQMMINDVKVQSCEQKIGKAALSVRLMLVEVVISPTVLSSTETWFNINQDEQKMITQIHRNILTQLLHLPKHTSYLGIISELNIMRFIDTIWYKKFMWYHRLINSDDKRKAKNILSEQMHENNNWFTELEHHANESGININEQYVKQQSYEQFKHHVKEKIRLKLVRELQAAREKHTKLRSINPGKRQNYIEQCTIHEASSIMKIRLHMVHAKANYGGGTCRSCGEEEETTEHILWCQSEGEIEYDVQKREDVSWLKKINNIYKTFDEQYTK